MIPQDFVKEYKRMCETYKRDKCTCGYSSNCDGNCPLFKLNCEPDLIVNTSNAKHFSEIYTKVEEWSNAHPSETRQSEFLKICPNAKLQNGIVNICPMNCEKNFLSEEFDCSRGTDCIKCMKSYWFTPIEKEENE